MSIKMKTPSVKMKASSAMKDSGIEWIGEIPEHWEVRKLKYVCDMKTGGTPKESIGVNNYSGVPWIKPSNLTDNVKISQYSQYISEDVFNKCGYTLFPAGSTLLCCIASIGKCGYAIKPVYSNQQITALVPKSNIVSLYITYFIKYLKDKLIYDAACNVVPILNTQYLKNIQMPHPPIEEQRLIAVQLNQICGTLDNTKADIEKQIEILNEYKKSVITEAVTKGLDKNVELKDSGIDWIGEVPEHWDIVKGKYILKLLKKVVKETDDVVTCFRDGEVTLRKNRREEGFTISEKEIGYQGIDIGDLVVHGMDGFAGAIGISDSRGKGSPVLNVLDSSQNKKYLMYFLRDLAYKDIFLATATGIRVRSCDLRWNKLAVLEFNIPPIEEQEEIVAYLDSKCSEIDSIIEAKKQQLELLEEYKKSIIYEYVTGKREVSEPLDGVTASLDEVSAKPDFAVAQNTQSVSIELAGDSHNE